MECMIVQGINDSEEELQQIRYHLERINPDRVYINVPIRPPAEKWVQIPSQEGLIRIKEVFSNVVELFLPETGKFQSLSDEISLIEDEIVQIVKRHPMRLEQIIELLRQKKIQNPQKIIDDLEKAGLVNKLSYQNQIFILSSEIKMGNRGGG